jgi:hypothetical protein
LEYLYFVYVVCGCTPPELDAIRPDGVFQNIGNFKLEYTMAYLDIE